MRTIALLILAFALPTAAAYTIVVTLHASRRLAESRHRPSAPETAERLTATLRRLRADLEEAEISSDTTARHHRILALRGAYLDALGDACARLGVSPPPGGDRARQADIYRTEAALRERGLDVRETAAR